jgi:hypothetical protein
MIGIEGGQCRLIGWSIICQLPSAVVVVNPSPLGGGLINRLAGRLPSCSIPSNLSDRQKRQQGGSPETVKPTASQHLISPRYLFCSQLTEIRRNPSCYKKIKVTPFSSKTR